MSTYFFVLRILNKFIHRLEEEHIWYMHRLYIKMEVYTIFSTDAEMCNLLVSWAAGRGDTSTRLQLFLKTSNQTRGISDLWHLVF